MKVGTTTIAATSQGLAAAGDLGCRQYRHFSAPGARRPTRSRRVRAGGLEKLPGIGAGRRLVDMDVGDDRGADEQRALLRVVSLELDADRQPLHHLDEVAGGVLRRQQRQRRSGPHREAGNAALEHVSAAVHVDIEIDRLADTQVAQLRLLEIGIDPDLVERADRHEILADLDIIARIDVSARDDAVDLRDDVAIAKIELGLGEIALGGLELGLGLLDGRRLRPPAGRRCGRCRPEPDFSNSSSICVGRLVVRMEDTQLSRALDQRRLRLADGGEGLIEIGRHLAEVPAVQGSAGKPRETRI